MNVLVGIFGLEVQQLRHDKVGHLVFDRTDDENESVLEKPRINVVGPLAPRRLFDDHRYEIQCLCAHCCSCPFAVIIFSLAGGFIYSVNATFFVAALAVFKKPVQRLLLEHHRLNLLHDLRLPRYMLTMSSEFS